MNHELFENARWLIGAIARGLHARQGEGVAEALSRLAAQDVSEAAFREPEPGGLAALAHLPQCIGETMLLDPDLAAAIAAVEDGLCWRPFPGCPDTLPVADTSADCGWAEIVGPGGFFTGEDFLLGLLLLGPGRQCRDHFHPAPELDWPLTSSSRWSRDGGAFAEQPQGATIWHPSMSVHATVTGPAPLLAVWCWPHDTGTPARLKP